MQKKNILILNYKNHSSPGGTQTYVKNLINILTCKGHKIFEIDYEAEENLILDKTKNYNHIKHKIKFSQRNGKIFNIPFIVFKYFLSVIKFNNLIKKTIKNKKIDIVIDNTTSIPYVRKSRINYIWVIHFDLYRLYKEQKMLFKNRLINLITLKSNRFNYNEIVVYTEKDKKLLLSIDKKINSKKIYTCPLAHKNTEEINNFNLQEKLNYAKNVVWISKLEQAEKNIKFIAKIAEKLVPYNIYIYIYMEMDQTKILF